MSNTQITHYVIEPLAGYRVIRLDESLAQLELIQIDLKQQGFALVRDWKGTLSEWRYVRNYEIYGKGIGKELGVVRRYAVTSSGLVIDFERKEIRKPCGQQNYNKAKGKKVYYYVTTINYRGEQGSRESELRSIHQLVAEAFLGYRQGARTLTGFTYEQGIRIERTNPLVVNHLNEDTSDNSVGNLNVLTSGDNTRYSKSMPYRVMSPDGVEYQGDNLYRFCLEQGLDYQGMRQLLKNKRVLEFQYWTRYEPQMKAA